MLIRTTFFAFACASCMLSCQTQDKISIDRELQENRDRMLTIIKRYDPEGKYIPLENMKDPETYPEEFRNVDWALFEEQVQYAVVWGSMIRQQNEKTEKYRPLFKEFYQKLKAAKTQEERDELHREYASKIPMDINNGDSESWGPSQWEEVKKRKN